jgi:hypothetical protein
LYYTQIYFTDFSSTSRDIKTDTRSKLTIMFLGMGRRVVFLDTHQHFFIFQSSETSQAGENSVYRVLRAGTTVPNEPE